MNYWLSSRHLKLASAIKKIYRIKIKPGEKQVEKNLVLDLLEEGYGFVEKAEGIALMDSRIIAVLSDNDFGFIW